MDFTVSTISMCSIFAVHLAVMARVDHDFKSFNSQKDNAIGILQLLVLV